MVSRFTAEEKERITEGIRQKYEKVAISPRGNFRYPTGRKGLEAQNYDPELLNRLPDEVAESFCGVGNPFSLGTIPQGGAVLDAGCGAGVDSLIAAMIVGPAGIVFGIDLVPEMVERARLNLGKTSLNNVEFKHSSADNTGFPDSIFDAVISNGAINLIPEKATAMAEFFRVLKPEGRLMIADQILVGEPPGDTRAMVDNWAG